VETYVSGKRAYSGKTHMTATAKRDYIVETYVSGKRAYSGETHMAVTAKRETISW
jgi:hypothetical protein